MKTVHIWLDDVRDPPDFSWRVERTARKAWNAIRDNYARGNTIVVSLDHDLGKLVDGTEETGYDLLTWIESEVGMGHMPNLKITFAIHSANPVGIENMFRAITTIQSLL
jgi:hypothetical protein